jgi:predicted nucleotide-binding protein
VELTAFDPSKINQKHPPELTALSSAIRTTLARIFGDDTADYRHYSEAATLQWAPSRERTRTSTLEDYVRGYDANRQHSLALLGQAIQTLKEDLAELDPEPKAVGTAPESRQPNNKVFLVHGHDEAALHAAARFVERLGLEAIILGEQPDQGRAIIEKFEDCAAEVGFAIVLLTPDDLSGPAGGIASGARARQNVIFELGYFAGRLGRGRTCLLRKGNVEIPSDLYGVIYTDMDATNGWQLKLVGELKAAKLDFNADDMWK